MKDNPNQYIQTDKNGEQFVDIRTYKRSDDDNTYDTRVSNSLFSQLKIAEFASVFLSMVGLLLSIINYELRDQEEGFAF